MTTRWSILQSCRKRMCLQARSRNDGVESTAEGRACVGSVDWTERSAASLPAMPISPLSLVPRIVSFCRPVRYVGVTAPICSPFEKQM